MPRLLIIMPLAFIHAGVCFAESEYSIAEGDKPETYLHLDGPICVDASPAAETAITRVQLTIGDYAAFRTLMGKRVVASGKLMHGISGHRHAPVPLQVDAMKAADFVPAARSPQP